MWNRSSNFSRFIENFSIIKCLYEEENKDIRFIARWLRMSIANLQLWINRYFRSKYKQKEIETVINIKKQRIDLIKDKIKQFMMNNKGRWVVVNQMVDYINNYNFNKQQHNDTSYYEVYTILKKELNFSWRKASQRPPRWFQESLENARNIFKQFVLKLKEREFIIVWIDESSFNSSALPLYSWMLKGKDPDRIIRTGSERFNVIAAQWRKEVYFMLKRSSTKEEQFKEFLMQLDNQLRFRLSKNTYEKRMVIIFDNASIHKTKTIKLLIKKLKWVAFTIPPYSPELNQIEHTFGILKTKISKRNFNAKCFEQIVKEEIVKLIW